MCACSARCRKCLYRGRAGGTLCCDFFVVTGQLRKCKAGQECVRFEPGTLNKYVANSIPRVPEYKPDIKTMNPAKSNAQWNKRIGDEVAIHEAQKKDKSEGDAKKGKKKPFISANTLRKESIWEFIKSDDETAEMVNHEADKIKPYTETFRYRTTAREMGLLGKVWFVTSGGKIFATKKMPESQSPAVVAEAREINCAQMRRDAILAFLRSGAVRVELYHYGRGTTLRSEAKSYRDAIRKLGESERISVVKNPAEGKIYAVRIPKDVRRVKSVVEMEQLAAQE